MFHAIDFRFLDKEGKTDTWTIIFYVVHLLKGGILIGWLSTHKEPQYRLYFSISFCV